MNMIRKTQIHKYTAVVIDVFCINGCTSLYEEKKLLAILHNELIIYQRVIITSHHKNPIAISCLVMQGITNSVLSMFTSLNKC